MQKSGTTKFTPEQLRANELLDEALHKFYWGCLTLEQLWAIQHHIEDPDRSLPPLLEVPITTGQSELVFLFGYLFDTALYTWRSFLDFYLKYLLFFLTEQEEPKISTGKFSKRIRSHLRNADDEKCAQVYSYLKTKVLSKAFGNNDESWGDFLRSLRDKTTHQKLLRPTLSDEENSQGLRISWPNIQGKRLAELSQWEFENNAFQMLVDLFPILYGFAWVPGPFKPGMFEKLE